MSGSLSFSIVPLAEALNHEPADFPEKRRQRILVVDDERLIADTLSIILTKTGYDVSTAYDATTALDLAYETLPDLLLTDVVMPGMTGVELAIVLTQGMPQCKVLLFSGQASTSDMLLTARALGHEFNMLPKPIHPTDLLSQIRERLASQTAPALV
jgi:CheY-like chemotaxis protein